MTSILGLSAEKTEQLIIALLGEPDSSERKYRLAITIYHQNGATKTARCAIDEFADDEPELIAVRFFGLDSVKHAKKIEFAIELRTVEKTRRTVLILANE